MVSKEKAEMLKNTIEFLYAKEGRSKSYISRLLEINRKTISAKLKEWNTPEPQTFYHMKPSTKKNLNKHKEKIKSMLDKGNTITEISKATGVDRKTLSSIYFKKDEVLKEAYMNWKQRNEISHQNTIERAKNKSSYDYNIKDLENEVWKPILGYDGYEVSNMGRVKHFSKRYKSYHLLKPYPNCKSGYYYISLVNNKGKNKNLSLSRLVAGTFIPHDLKKNTVNHKDGDISNNILENLEWVSQSENNKHSYKVLQRNPSNSKRYDFDIIKYKDKYEFKTVTAFSKFLKLSETQTRRYLETPQKYDIKLIKNRID